MRQPHLLVKAAALTSSVLLLGGFVAYRANAFNWGSLTESDNSNAHGAISVAPARAPQVTAPADPSIGSSSQAGTGSVSGSWTSSDPNATIVTGSQPTMSGGATFLQSSKGGVVFSPVPPANSAPHATVVPAKTGTTLMSSSKSIVIAPPMTQAAAVKPAPNQSPQSQSAQRSR